MKSALILIASLAMFAVGVHFAQRGTDCRDVHPIEGFPASYFTACGDRP